MNHGWEKYKLCEIGRIDFGKRIVAKDTIPGPYYVYGGGGATFKSQEYNRENCMIISRFAMSPECVRFVKGKFFLNDSGLSVKSICDRLNQDFLDKYLWANQSNIYNMGRGAAQRNLNTKALADFYIQIPPIETQRQVAEELDKINELIEVKRSQLADLDVLAQSLFYEMFGDPIENPKEWKISKVSEILETGSGGTPSKSVDEFWSSEDIPWIGSNMCQNKILYETDGKFISKLGLENSSAKLLEPDTIIIALVGATIGKVALLKIPTSTNQNIGFIKPNKKIINPIFLFYTIQGLYSLFLEIGNGKFKMANLSFIRNLPIIIPPISLQNEFAMRIEAIEEQKKSIESSITDLQTLLASRMDYWFND